MEQRKHPSTPTLKRPQNRHYFFHKKSPFTQRAVKLSLEDVDKIFDLYDDDEDDMFPPSPVEETQARAAQVPKGKVLQSATTSNRPVLDIELNSPCKNLALFKTSSPIERDENSSPVERDEQDDMGRLSPIPFYIDEEEEPERVLQKTTDVMHTFEVESPSERITFKKSLAPLKKVAAPQMAAPQIHTFEVESPPERITLKKTTAPSKKVAAPQQGYGHVPVVSAVTREPHNTVQEKKSTGLKETPATSKKLVTPQINTFEVESPPEKITLMKTALTLTAPLKKLVTPQINTFEVESPPEKITLKKTLAPLKKVEAPHKETGPGPSKALKESEMPAEVRREKPKQGKGDKLVSALSQEPQRAAQETASKIPALSKKVAAPQQGNGHPPVTVVRQEKPPNTAQVKKSNELKETPGPSKNLAAPHKETGPRQKPQNTAQEPPVEKSPRGETNFDAFLKLKETGRSKPTPQMKICLPIRAPTPPPEEDEFRILEEDDVPLIYNFSRKNKSRPRMKQGTTSDAEVKGSVDKFSLVETQPEEAEKRQVSSEAGGTDDNQTGKIPSKERTAAEEEPKGRTTNGKESMEIKKRGPKSRDGKEKAAKTRVKSTKKTGEGIEEPEDAMELQSQKPPGKGHGGQTRVKSTKETRERIQEPDDAVAMMQSQEPPGKEHGGLHQDEDVTSAEKIRNPGGGPKRTSKDLADGKTKKLKIPSPVENASSPDRFVAGKRKRKPPGDWWLSHGLDTASPDVDTVKISQHGEVEKTQKKQSEPGQKAYKKKAALTKVRKEKKKQQHHTPEKTMSVLSEQVQNQEELQQQADFDPVPSSSLVFPLGEASIMTGDRLFDRINHHTPNAKVHNKQASNTPKTIPEHVASLLPEKWKRKSVVCEVPENDVEIPAIQLQKPNSKSPKTRKKARMERMTAFEQEQASLTSDAECPTVEVVATDITETSAECWPSKNDRFQNGKRRFSDNKLQGFTSGPSSMIALEAYEEQDMVSVHPSPGIHSALSATQLCVFPLVPVALQASDEENLTKWFRILWPATVKTAAGHIDPDAFRWFSYRGSMMGVCEDILHNNLCVGKMLLGSQGQKPLWVDHSATTVYHVLNSAVSVKIDGTVSQYSPGLSFTVPCGHAHAIKNLTDEPAVLYFTRIRSQNAD